jgi:chromosome segregation ATPase
MKKRAFAAALAAALLSHGCGWMRVAPSPGAEAAGEPWPAAVSLWRSAAAAEEEEVLALLAYYHRIAGVPAEEQRREFNAVSQAFGRDKSEHARLKLALLLSLPNTSFRDDARLASLLENSASRNASPESARRHLATLLSRLNAERQRQGAQLREEQKKLETQIKDEQRRADEQQKRADELQRRAEELQKRGDELQEKLDKLLAIERELRARTPRRPPR